MTTDDHALQADRAIAARLRRTWDPFFARFGRLTEVQRSVIPAILEGHDILVCSPTASGKTEAACAPLLERLGSVPVPWTVLYVSPTRALVNDLYHRLAAPVAALGLRLVRRTGEHKSDLTDPHLLLTTPESLDSLLCRGRLEPQGHVLAQVRAVVLDEIHLIHGTPRGTQVAWLLRRLRRLRAFAMHQQWVPDDGLQVLALSATVQDPGMVARAYLQRGATLTVPGTRAIVVDAAGGSGPTEEALLRRLEMSDAPQKVLVFCNTRRRVDDLAARLRHQLQELGFDVEAHHGSLSQRVREEAEEEVRLTDRIVLFSTSTLEIGIDIGDIDLVVLDAPPPDVSSFLQRIGRGNRRRDSTTVMPCASAKADPLLYQALLAAAAKGDLGPGHQGPHYAVARQQLASFIFQGPRTSRPIDQLSALASECEPALAVAALIDHLVETGEFARDGDRVRLGAAWLDAAASGAIHSNIEAALGSDVVDATSGEKLAHRVSRHSGRTIGVGGKTRVVRSRRDRRIEVDQPKQGEGGGGDWHYSTSRRFVGASQPYAVRQLLAVPPDVWPIVVDGGTSFAFHLGGGEIAALLSLLAPVPESAAVTPWYLRVNGTRGTKPRWLREVDAPNASSMMEARLEKLEAVLARPHANRHLPTVVRLAEVKAWLRLPEGLSAVTGARWVPADGQLRAALRELVRG